MDTIKYSSLWWELEYIPSPMLPLHSIPCYGGTTLGDSFFNVEEIFWQWNSPDSLVIQSSASTIAVSFAKLFFCLSEKRSKSFHSTSIQSNLLLHTENFYSNGKRAFSLFFVDDHACFSRSTHTHTQQLLSFMYIKHARSEINPSLSLFPFFLVLLLGSSMVLVLHCIKAIVCSHNITMWRWWWW